MCFSREREFATLFYKLSKDQWSSNIVLINLCEFLMDSPDLHIRDLAFLTLVEIQHRVKDNK